MKKASAIYMINMVDNFKITVELSLLIGFLASLYDYLAAFIMDEKEFMAMISIAIIVDHVVGSYMWFIKKRFDLKKNIIGLFVKIGLCICGFLLFESLNHILGQENFLATYFKVVTNLTLFLYPAGSAFMNMSVITKGTFPPIGWIQKIKSFNEDLNFDKFKDFKDERQEQ